MPSYIIRIKDYYLEWSTIVDAPTTYGMKRKEFESYYQDEYGNAGMSELPGRLKRADENGTSAFDHVSLNDFIAHNRAGNNESSLTLDEIYEKYCLRKES